MLCFPDFDDVARDAVIFIYLFIVMSFILFAYFCIFMYTFVQRELFVIFRLVFLTLLPFYSPIQIESNPLCNA